MGFNKRKMEDRRRKAAELEAAARRALGPQIIEDSVKLVEAWNARQAAHKSLRRANSRFGPQANIWLLPQKQRLDGLKQASFLRVEIWSASVLRPSEGPLKAVVAPEQFSVRRHETRRAENAEPLCLLSLRTQPGFVYIRSRRIKHGLRLNVQSREYIAKDRGVTDLKALTELRHEYGSTELLTPRLLTQRLFTRSRAESN
jgi:hypothetical protein